MNILIESATTYVFPTGQFFTDEYYAYDQYMYNIANMLTEIPMDYTDFVTSGSNVIQVRTDTSNGLRVVGTNISNVSVQIYAGEPHDSWDGIVNGKFDNWTGGFPDDWAVGPNLNISQESSSISIGGISYTYAVKMNFGHFSTSNAMYQNFTVIPGDDRYCSIAYRKDNDNTDLYYYIYDWTNKAFIIPETQFPVSSLSSPGYTMGWLNVLFTVPSGCTEAQVVIQYRKASIDPVYIYAVSSKSALKSFDAEDMSQVLNVRSGSSYSMYKKDYPDVLTDYYDTYGTELTNQTVFMSADSEDSYIRVGRIMTGVVETFSDPLPESFTQGMSPLSDSVDMPFGGRLSRTIYNRDVLHCEIQETNETADDFMLRFVPMVGLDCMFIDINDEWFIYGYFSEQGMPVTTYYENEQIINFSIEEAP